MSRSFLLLSLLASFVILCANTYSQELSADEQKALVQKFQAHRAEFPAMSAEFTEERTTQLLNKPVVSTGTIAFQAPNKFRRDLRGNSPSLTVCDGSQLWIHFPKFKQAEHYTLGQKQFFDDSIAALTAGLNFQNVEKFFRFTVAKDGASYKISLVPRSGSLRKILKTLTVWLDADGTIQRTEAALPEGDRLQTTYRNVKSAKMSDAKFEFTPPAGTEVTTPLGK